MSFILMYRVRTETKYLDLFWYYVTILYKFARNKWDVWRFYDAQIYNLYNSAIHSIPKLLHIRFEMRTLEYQVNELIM